MRLARLASFAAFALALPAQVAHARSKPQAFRGELPPEVKDELRRAYAPPDARAYWKSIHAQEVDLDNDGIFDLVVEAPEGNATATTASASAPSTAQGDAKPDARDKAARALHRFALFQKVGARYRPIGEIACVSDHWRLADTAGQWESLECGDARYRFDEGRHAYAAEGPGAGSSPTATREGDFPPAFRAALEIYRAGHYGEACGPLDDALGDHPTDEMRFYDAMAHEKARHTKRARELLTALADKGYKPAGLGLGDIAWDAGDGPTAIAQYRTYLDTSPAPSDDAERARRRTAGEELPPPPKKKRAD